MIGYLKGEVLHYQEGKILIGMGDQQGGGVIGYQVVIPQNASYVGIQEGQKLELFVYTHVREDALDLFGFCTQREKDLFMILLGVNGIGPKSALGILSASSTADLVDAILHGKQAYLTALPGIGKKTAERLVLELRDVLKKKLDWAKAMPASANRATLRTSVSPGDSNIDPFVIEDAKAALSSLGYRDQEVDLLIERTIRTLDSPPKKVEELVRVVLRQLSS